MRRLAAVLVPLLFLAACSGEDSATTTGEAAPATATERQLQEAGSALRDAGREVGEAASSAAGDVRDAAAPTVERAREAGAEALDATRNGLNDLARGTACQTARGANDQAGIAANC